MTQDAFNNEEGIRINDKRRLDPDTFEVREQETASAPVGDDVLEELVVESEGAVAELTADLQRVHAEYANYRKRVARDNELARENAIASVMNDLLPILDDLDRAREHNELEGAFKTVGESLENTMTRIGLERFGEAGVEFDPAEHEALTHENRDDVTGPTVVNVYQPGYRFAGRVLRPARVAVADN